MSRSLHYRHRLMTEDKRRLRCRRRTKSERRQITIGPADSTFKDAKKDFAVRRIWHPVRQSQPPLRVIEQQRSHYFPLAPGFRPTATIVNPGNGINRSIKRHNQTVLSKSFKVIREMRRLPSNFEFVHQANVPNRLKV